MAIILSFLFLLGEVGILIFDSFRKNCKRDKGNRRLKSRRMLRTCEYVRGHFIREFHNILYLLQWKWLVQPLFVLFIWILIWSCSNVMARKTFERLLHRTVQEWFKKNLMINSIPRYSKEIDYNIIILNLIFFVKIAVCLWFPEATSAHVEPGVSFLKYYDCTHKLLVLTNVFLNNLNYLLWCGICPFLC